MTARWSVTPPCEFPGCEAPTRRYAVPTDPRAHLALADLVPPRPTIETFDSCEQHRRLVQLRHVYARQNRA